MSDDGKIHEAIRASHEDDEDVNGAVLIGWVVVAEWLGGDGKRSLTRITGTPGGEPPPQWQVRGYMYEALFGKWSATE